MKPILFNTDMVEAIMNGQKTCTRRILKTNKFPDKDIEFGYTAFTPKGYISVRGYYGEHYGEAFVKLPYNPGDTLYVRETFSPVNVIPKRYLYKTHCPEANGLPIRWRPSIHMPKEAARVFLKVKTVTVQRLKDMVLADVLCEGISEEDTYEKTWDKWHRLWDSTVPADKLDVYGCNANPYVWVISFERVEKDDDR